MRKITNLQWPDKLALIKHYEPSDADAARVFNVQPDELKVAMDLEKQGTLVPSSDLDVTQYAALFATGGAETIQAPVSKDATGPTSVVKTPVVTAQPPQTATKKTAAPKKRGRKGSAIATAFAAIPSDPTPVAEFAATHGVSIAVLRQSKRFDVDGVGTVHVKKNKASKVLEIWRSASPTT